VEVEVEETEGTRRRRHAREPSINIIIYIITAALSRGASAASGPRRQQKYRPTHNHIRRAANANSPSTKRSTPAIKGAKEKKKVRRPPLNCYSEPIAHT
jgi:hypothetical protein